MKTLALILLSAFAAAAQVTQPSWTHPQFLNSSAQPLAGGFVCTFQSGSSSTLQSTYTDYTGGTPNTNPIVLDGGGFANIWLTNGAAYRFKVYAVGGVGTPNCMDDTTLGTLQWTVDGIETFSPVTPAGSNGQIQYNNFGAFAGAADATYSLATGATTFKYPNNICMIFSTGGEFGAQFNSCVTFLGGKGLIIVAAGTYSQTVTAVFPVAGGLYLKGQGTESTIVNCSNGGSTLTNGNCFYAAPSSNTGTATNGPEGGIADIQITGTSTVTNIVDVQDRTGWTFQNDIFYAAASDPTDCVLLESVNNNNGGAVGWTERTSFTNTHIGGCGTGLEFRTTTTSGGVAPTGSFEFTNLQGLHLIPSGSGNIGMAVGANSTLYGSWLDIGLNTGSGNYGFSIAGVVTNNGYSHIVDDGAGTYLQCTGSGIWDVTGFQYGSGSMGCGNVSLLFAVTSAGAHNQGPTNLCGGWTEWVLATSDRGNAPVFPEQCVGFTTGVSAQNYEGVFAVSDVLGNYPDRTGICTGTGNLSSSNYVNAACLYANGNIDGASLNLGYCTSSASPAVCGAKASGAVVIAAAASTVVVHTTAVTANSQIQLTFDSSLGSLLSVTCNTTAQQPYVTARTASTSFTITTGSTFTTNPGCISYTIIN